MTDQLFAPPGHFYSPITDHQDSAGHLERIRHKPSELRGIEIDDRRLTSFWADLVPHMETIPFTDHEQEDRRYYYVNDQFSYGDACIYWGFLSRFRPSRIIEIGSGYSSALALDARETLGLATEFTFVEPYPDRLNMLLRNDDRDAVTIVETKVQTVDPTIVDVLEDNDLLFIDSSHVFKTGSNVVFELFELLPRLKRGVWVAIHDMFYPFEYPESWIQDDWRSWNELYAVRAFLTNNTQFTIEFFNHYFGLKFGESLGSQSPVFMKNFGGLLWLWAQ